MGKWGKSHNFKITIILIDDHAPDEMLDDNISRSSMAQGLGWKLNQIRQLFFSTKPIITWIIGKEIFLHSLFRVAALLIRATSVMVF